MSKTGITLANIIIPLDVIYKISEYLTTVEVLKKIKSISRDFHEYVEHIWAPEVLQLSTQLLIGLSLYCSLVPNSLRPVCHEAPDQLVSPRIRSRVNSQPITWTRFNYQDTFTYAALELSWDENLVSFWNNTRVVTRVRQLIYGKYTDLCSTESSTSPPLHLSVLDLLDAFFAFRKSVQEFTLDHLICSVAMTPYDIPRCPTSLLIDRDMDSSLPHEQRVHWKCWASLARNIIKRYKYQANFSELRKLCIGGSYLGPILSILAIVPSLHFPKLEILHIHGGIPMGKRGTDNIIADNLRYNDSENILISEEESENQLWWVEDVIKALFFGFAPFGSCFDDLNSKRCTYWRYKLTNIFKKERFPSLEKICLRLTALEDPKVWGFLLTDLASSSRIHTIEWDKLLLSRVKRIPADIAIFPPGAFPGLREVVWFREDSAARVDRLREILRNQLRLPELRVRVRSLRLDVYDENFGNEMMLVGKWNARKPFSNHPFSSLALVFSSGEHLPQRQHRLVGSTELALIRFDHNNPHHRNFVSTLVISTVIQTIIYEPLEDQASGLEINSIRTKLCDLNRGFLPTKEFIVASTRHYSQHRTCLQ